MNKHVFFLLLSFNALQLQAQTRLSLYEEFTGEQCFPCATANPGLQALIAANSASVVHITYPTPYPVAGPIYNGYRTINNARIAYYGITTAPQGRLDGTGTGTGSTFPAVPGHVSNLTQTDITAASAVSAPFSITVMHSWNNTGDSLTVQAGITAPAAYAPAGANLKLRVALIEHLHYTAAPGINGEQDFPNVVREMYPSAAGTALPASWTMSQSTTYTIKGLVPKFVDKSAATLVVWIQNDADKRVVQASVSAYIPLPLDAAAASSKPPAKLICAPGNINVAPVALLHNAGTTTLTSAKIYYRTETGPYTLYPWTGNLGPGGTTAVSLPAITVSGGNHSIIDSVVMPNGVADINPGNNVAQGPVAVYNTVPVNLPISTGFELAGAAPSGWVLYDADSNGRNFIITQNVYGTGSAGYGGSTYFLMHNNYYVPAGEANYAILPAVNLPAGPRALTFAYARAPYDAEADKLEVVYSIDCGMTWTPVWSASGASLATAPATTDYFVPTAAQWMLQLVDMSPVPVGAMTAFRATSDFGNNLYIDNVLLAAGTGTGKVSALSGIALHPNPAAALTELDFILEKSGRTGISIQDATGRMMAVITDATLPAGPQRIQIPVAAFPAGMYNIIIRTEAGTFTQRLVVSK